MQKKRVSHGFMSVGRGFFLRRYLVPAKSIRVVGRWCCGGGGWEIMGRVGVDLSWSFFGQTRGLEIVVVVVAVE